MTINHATAEFLREVLFRFKQYRKQHQHNTGQHYTPPDATQKQLTLTKELLARYAQFGDKAEMTKLEQSQVTQLANWLVTAWHDIHGSERVPAMVFTESGVGWMSEGQVQ
jgi:hypothetical protein